MTVLFGSTVRGMTPLQGTLRCRGFWCGPCSWVNDVPGPDNPPDPLNQLGEGKVRVAQSDLCKLLGAEDYTGKGRDKRYIKLVPKACLDKVMISCP